ncbi:MAG TPA: carboxypeptidase regulatory-like domain-containing protein, partial [Armatimonadota bacterium]|nr:carboxypeptidase regulatory-like domain-containing protein [Armatimonadota bacterium]
MTTMLNRPLLLLGILSTLIVTTLPGASLHASDAVPDTPPISGIVVREDGTPIAGATVMAAGVDWDPDRRELLDRTRTTTDEHGRFRLSGAVIYPAWGSQWITAVADGCAAASSPATLRERELRFVLRPETRLPVRVLDTQGKGVPGVRLLIWDAVDRRSTREKPDPAARSIAAGTGVSSLLAAPTDQDGRTVVRSLPRGGHVSLMVQDRKWVQRLVRGEEVLRRVLLPDGPAAAEEVFRVGPAGVVEGRLRTEAGQPLAGYRVSVGTGFPGGLIAPTTTDAQGRFRLDGLPAGRVQLLGGTHPALQDFLPGVLDLSLIAGEHRRDCDIVCRRGTLVTGRLLDAANGKPVAGASISAGRPGGDCVVMFGVGDSDASGRFRFRLAPGRWLLNLRLPSEYDDGRSQLVDAERFRERFEAENGQDRPLGDLRVKLRQLITLRGVVLGVDGKPAPGATVYFRHLEARADSLLLTPHVTAGLDGAFEIPRLRYQDGVFLLRARKGSLATTEDVKFDVREEPGPQTLTLAERPLALLRGRVVDDAGNPVPNSGVVLTEGH